MGKGLKILYLIYRRKTNMLDKLRESVKRQQNRYSFVCYFNNDNAV